MQVGLLIGSLNPLFEADLKPLGTLLGFFCFVKLSSFLGFIHFLRKPSLFCLLVLGPCWLLSRFRLCPFKAHVVWAFLGIGFIVARKKKGSKDSNQFFIDAYFRLSFYSFFFLVDLKILQKFKIRFKRMTKQNFMPFIILF